MHDGSQFALFMASELASELYCDEVLAGDGSILHLDRVRRVTAVTPPESHWPPDAYLQEQHRRFLSGS